MTDLVSSTIDSLFGVIDESITTKRPSSVYTRRNSVVEPRQIKEDVDLDGLINNLELELDKKPLSPIRRSVFTKPTEVVEIKEDYIEPRESTVTPSNSIPNVVNNMMDDLSNKLSTYVNRTNTKYIEPDPQDFNLVIENLTRQIQDVRKLVLENTIVSGIGQGGDGQTPGSGEVWFYRLDDVDMSELEDGDTIVWDQSLGKWKPAKPSLDPDPVCDYVDGGSINLSNSYDDTISGGDYLGYYPDGELNGGDSKDTCPVVITTSSVNDMIVELRQRLSELEQYSISIENGA
jgi:hypothetical protein